MKIMQKLVIFLIFPVLLVGCIGGTKEEVYYRKNSSNIVAIDNVIIVPEPTSIIQLQIDTLEAEIPTSKDDGALPVMFSFIVDGTTLNTYGEISVQGSSTAFWPKKNWKLNFYADEERTEDLLIQVGDSVPSDLWIAKAEWVDPSFLRNALSFNLWGAMTESRHNTPQREVDYAWIGEDNMDHGVQTGAQGYPVLHPMQVVMNNEHYGIAMLTLGHEPRNFNLDLDNPEHIYMEFDARGGEDETKDWGNFSVEGLGTWIDSYHPNNEDFSKEQLKAIDDLDKLINGSQEYFEANFDKHLDKTNMIDMLLFIEMIYDNDSIAQDIEMVTYDLEKWYFLPWDKDTTFGMEWDGSGVSKSSETNILINFEEEEVTQKPWYKTYHAFQDDVEARYAQLRDDGVFSLNNLYELTGQITKKIPQEIWLAEKLRWAEDGRPSMDDTSTAQVLSWYEQRLKTLDERFNYYSEETEVFDESLNDDLEEVEVFEEPLN